MKFKLVLAYFRENITSFKALLFDIVIELVLELARNTLMIDTSHACVGAAAPEPDSNRQKYA